MDEEFVKETLKRFISEDSRIEGAILVSPDGFPVLSMIEREESERFAAMGASFLSLAKSMASAARGSALKKVVVETKNGNIVGVPLENGLFLFLLVR